MSDGSALSSGEPDGGAAVPSSSSLSSTIDNQPDESMPGSAPKKVYSIVQCDHCRKWHNVPSSVDLDALPDLWFCSMNTWDPPEEARCDLRRKMGVVAPEKADEPYALLERREWLLYAREIAKFVSACKKLTLPQIFMQGIETLYLKVQEQDDNKMPQSIQKSHGSSQSAKSALHVYV